MPPLLLQLPPPPIHLLTSAAATQTLTAALHAAAIKTNLHSDPFLTNALLHSYSRCGLPDLAHHLFDQMPHRDVVSYTTLISSHTHNTTPNAAISLFISMLTSHTAPPPNEFTLAAVLQACAQLRDGNTARVLHAHIVTTGFISDGFVANSLLDAYTKSALIPEAEKLLYELDCRDVVSWSAVISGCVLNGVLERALELFVWMLEDGVVPNVSTLLSVIQACSQMRECRLFGRVHGVVLKLGLDSDEFVANSLVKMYSKNGLVGRGMRVLFGSCECFDPDAMASIVQGCDLELGRATHGFLVKLGLASSTIVENSLMGMYARHEEIKQVELVFRRMLNKDIVSWNTLISSLVKSESPSRALECLTEIQGGGELALDVITVLSSIQACSEIASLQQGMILHGYALRFGFDRDVFTGNALIDMYSKAGRVELSKQVFKEMDVKDLGTWNSMIAAYGMHGDGESALRVFTELKERHQPNAITFNSVLSACGHSGLRVEGCECFKSMRHYGIEPSMEHYASMVDLLGRCGGIDLAWEFVQKMPVTSGADVWGVLLGVCVTHGNVEIAERAAEKLTVLEPHGTVWRVALANVYAKDGRWDAAAEVRAEMRRKGDRKEVGWSSVELDGGERFRFMAGDTRHPETSRIYGVWNAIIKHMGDAFV